MELSKWRSPPSLSDRLILAGVSGSGKTYFLRRLVPQLARVIAVDVCGALRGTGFDHETESLADFYEHFKRLAGKKTFRLLWWGADPQKNLHRLIADCLIPLGRSIPGLELCLLADEIPLLANPRLQLGSAANHAQLQTIATTGRNWGIGLFGAAQRLCDVPEGLRNQACRWVVFRQETDLDLQKIDGANARLRAELPKLKQGEFFYRESGCAWGGPYKTDKVLK